MPHLLSLASKLLRGFIFPITVAALSACSSIKVGPITTTPPAQYIDVDQEIRIRQTTDLNNGYATVASSHFICLPPGRYYPTQEAVNGHLFRAPSPVIVRAGISHGEMEGGIFWMRGAYRPSAIYTKGRLMKSPEILKAPEVAWSINPVR